MKRLCSRGFTLIEGSIGAAILAIAGLAVAGIVRHAMAQRAYTEKRVATVALASAITEHLRLIETCDLALGSGSGLTQTVDETHLQQLGTTAGQGWQFEIVLPEIHSGPSLSGTTLSSTAPNNVVLERRLRVDSLKLADGKRLPDVGANRRYLATIYLKTSEIDGLPFKEIPIGSTTVTIDSATSRVSTCGVMKSTSFAGACAEMGCTYDAAQTPPCRCLRSQVVCSAPGAVPVAFTSDGYPTCMQAGGEGSCPTGEYLVGFGIGYKECAALPTAAVPVTVNGACGGANGGIFADATATNAAGLCSAGTAAPASVSGSGPWSWACNGSGGGTNASCGATQTASPPSSTCLAGTPAAYLPAGVQGDTHTQLFGSVPIPPMGGSCAPPKVYSVCNGGVWQQINANSSVRSQFETCGGFPGDGACSVIVGNCANGTPTALIGASPRYWYCNNSLPGPGRAVLCSAP